MRAHIPRKPSNLTLRTRLALTYGGAFAVAGVILVATLYLLVSSAVDRQPVDTVTIAIESASAPDVPAFDRDLTTNPFSDNGGAPTSTDLIAQAEAKHLEAIRAEVEKINSDAKAATLGAMLTWSVLALGTMLVAALGLGWLMTSRVLSPLHTVTAAARRVADDNLHERIALIGPDDEIKDLADTFDEMLERLDRSFDAQRRFTANASHELRTPVAITRTVLEVAASDPDAAPSTKALSTTLLAVNERQEKTIEGLLTLASADQTLPRIETVDLDGIVRHITAEITAMAQAANVTVRVVHRSVRDHIVDGDGVLLERLVRNLIDNAIQYNHPGGHVNVFLDDDGLTVENTGHTVPASQVDGLFEPFRRLTADGAIADRRTGSTRTGVGLGLSIVRSIAVAHGGEANASARTTGGLIVRVRLSRSPQTTDPHHDAGQPRGRSWDGEG